MDPVAGAPGVRRWHGPGAGAAIMRVMSELASKTCVPCRGGVPPMDAQDAERYLAQVEGWGHSDHRRISRTFVFPDFAGALDFANRVGEIAEAEGHHPDLLVAWGRVEVTIWTHKVNGLTESDFILAAKIDQLA